MQIFPRDTCSDLTAQLWLQEVLFKWGDVHVGGLLIALVRHQLHFAAFGARKQAYWQRPNVLI